MKISGKEINQEVFLKVGSSGQNYFIEMRVHIVHQSIEH